MHKVNKIINALVKRMNKVHDLTVIVTRKAIDENDLPAVRVLLGKNKPEHVGTQFTDWRLIVHTDIALSAYDDEINTHTAKYVLAIHKQIMADITLDLPFIQDIEPLGQDETQFNTESEITIAEVPNSWLINYRANSQDPSQ